MTNIDYSYETHLQNAFESVSAWDLSEEELPEAVTQQAILMAGITPEYFAPESNLNNPYRPLRF